jgi:hypothetical protein
MPFRLVGTAYANHVPTSLSCACCEVANAGPGMGFKPDLKWLIRRMASLPITRQDWAFVFEVGREEATKVAWKVDPNNFGKLEQAPNASRVVQWFMKSHTKS